MGTALIFPGQGSQYEGMGKNIFNVYKIADDTFHEASEIIGTNLKNICLQDSLNELSKTIINQQVIYTLGVASYRIYMQEIGIIPKFFMGNGLGEITALTCANVIEFKDGIKLVKKRAEYMQEACEHSRLMYSDALKMKEELKKYHFNDFFIPVISNITSKPYKSTEELIEKFAFQLIKPVQWEKTIQYLKKNGIDKVVELSPGCILKGLIRNNFEKIKCFSFDDDFLELKTSVFYEEKPYLNNIVTLCLTNCISIKNNVQVNENEKVFLKASMMYNKIYDIYKELKKEMRLPKRYEIVKALDMIVFVMKAKKVDLDEQYRIIERIISISGIKYICKDFILKNKHIGFSSQT